MTGRSVPRLHVVTDDLVLGRPDFLSVAESILGARCEHLALHLRGPRSTGAHVHSLSERLLPLARAAGATLIVNDRVDIALVAGLDGAHLGQRSLSPRVARELLGPPAMVGVSSHSPMELDQAVSAGADYVFLGPIFETATHPGQPGQGWELIRTAAARQVPVIAIGGIDVARASDAVAAGAHGVAVIGGVWNEPHPRTAVMRYLDALNCQPGES